MIDLKLKLMEKLLKYKFTRNLLQGYKIGVLQ